MFDIGFGELIIIGILGLLILGPERLPVAIRTVSLWLGRFKRSYRQIRSDIEKEIGADDIRRQLHNEDIMQSLEKSKQELHDIAQQTHAAMHADTLPAQQNDQPSGDHQTALHSAKPTTLQPGQSKTDESI